MTVGTSTIDSRIELLAASGQLSDLSIFGFVTADTVTFDFTKQQVDVDTDSNGTFTPVANGDLDNANLITFELTVANLFVGIPDSFGFQIGTGVLALATIAPDPVRHPGDTRSWLAAKAGLTGGTLIVPAGLDVSATVDNLDVELNKGGGTPTAAPALDWTTDVDTDPTGVFTATGSVTVGTSTIDSRIELLAASGQLSDLSIFGFVTADTVTFDFTKQQVDVDTDSNGTFTPVANGDLDNANLITFELTVANLFVGIPDSFGFQIGTGVLALATIAPDPVRHPGDTRSWLAAKASLTGGTLIVPAGLDVSATVDNLDVEVNKGGGTPTAAPALDWTTDVDTDPTGAFSASGSVTVGTSTIDSRIELLAASGQLSDLSIFGFVTADTVTFDFTKQQVDVDTDSNGTFTPVANGDLDNANLITFELTVTSLFVGIPDSFGFEIASGTLALATIAPDPVRHPGDTRSWLAAKAGLTGGTLIVPVGLDVSATVDNLDVELNKGGGTPTAAPALDWTTDVDTDPTGAFSASGSVTVGTSTIDSRIELLAASGQLSDLSIFGFVTADTVTFDFTKQQVDVDTDSNGIFSPTSYHEPATNERSGSGQDMSTDPDARSGGLPLIGGDLDNANLITFELTVANLFVGIPDSFGFQMGTGVLALATIAPDPVRHPGDTRSWLAAKASLTGGTLIVPAGLDVRATVDNLDVELNKGSGTPVPPALDWTTDVDTDPTGVFTATGSVTVGTSTIDSRIELLAASGQLSDLSIFGFVTADTVSFDFTKRQVDVDTDSNGTFTPVANGDLDNANLITFELTVTNLFVGIPDSFGFQIGTGVLALATIAPDPVRHPGDTRSWLAAKAGLTGGMLVVPAGLEFSATVERLDVSINKGSGTPVPTALNWTTDVDLDPTGAFTPVGATGVPVGGSFITSTIELLAASGRLTDINIFGFVTGDVGFDFTKQQVDVDTDGNGTFTPVANGDLDNANLTTLELTIENLFIGIPDGIGFSVSSGSLALATIAPDPVRHAGDTRKFMAVRATLSGASLDGIDGITAIAQRLELEINQASPVSPTTRALDWANDVDLDPAGAFSASGGVPVGGSRIELDGTLLRVKGAVALTIQSFVHVSGEFVFEKGATRAITTVGSTTTTQVSVLKVGASNVKAFVGLNGPYWVVQPNGTVVAQPGEAMGLVIENFELGLALMKPVVATGQPASTKSYFALKAGGSARLVGFGDVLQLSATMAVEVNGGSDTATPGVSIPVVDFTAPPGALTVETGIDPDDGGPLQAPSVVMDFDGEVLRARGSVLLRIDEFVYVSGEFAFEKGGAPVTVTLEDLDGPGGQPAPTKVVRVLKVGASHVNAFVGVGGPYFEDSDGDGDIDGDDTPAADGAMGVVLENLEFGLALMKPTLLSDTSSYYAVRASGSVRLVGIDAVTITAEGLRVEVNGSNNPTAPVVNFDATTWADPDGLHVPTGLGATDFVVLDFPGRVIRASGFVTLALGEFVHVSGEFAFEKGATIPNVRMSSGPAKNLTALKIGASGVYAFVGLGGPYWQDSDDDGDIDGDDDPAAQGAVGLAIGNLEFGLALLKPTSLADTVSYFALKATAGSPPGGGPPAVELVGVEGVVLQVQTLSIEINDAKDRNPANTLPPPVIDFLQSFPASGTDPPGLLVPTGTTSSVRLDFASRLLRAQAAVSLQFSEVTLGATIFFEQTTRALGGKLIKIALQNLSFQLGDPALVSLTGASGLIVINNDGMGAEFEVPVSFSIPAGSPQFSFSGTLSLGINTSLLPIREEFDLPGVATDGRDNDADGQIDEAGEKQLLNLPGGKFLRLRGQGIRVTIAGVEATGTFQFEQITLPPLTTGGAPQKVIRIAASDVGLTFQNPGTGGVSLTNGRGGFVFKPNGTAGVLKGTFSGALPGVTASTEIALLINTSNVAVNESISLPDGNVRIDVPANYFQIALVNASIEFGDFFRISGDFTIVNLTDRTIYGARNVVIFLGQGPYLLENGEENPDAIGIKVTGATVGVVKFLNDLANTADDTIAVSAFGRAALVGLSDLQISGTLRVRINHTGRTVNQTVTLPGDPPGTISVNFASTAFVETFEVGVNAQGQPDPAAQLMIGVLNLFELRGDARFTRSPNGRVDVDVPQATVAIKIPSATGPQEAFSLTGSARFAIGGGQGFQLQDLRVNGFSIFGHGATIQTPASALRAPSVDLASPLGGAVVSAATLNENRYIDVVFNDVNRVGLNDGLITDDPQEFDLIGPGAANVRVNGAATRIDGRTFRYSFSGSFTNTADDVVEVRFRKGAFADARGAENATEAEQFTLYFSASLAPNDTLPAPAPVAILASPFAGSVVSKQSINAVRYIDVTFGVPSGGTLLEGTINGDEFRLSGPGSLNIGVNGPADSPNPLGFPRLERAPFRVGPNTFRYVFKAAATTADTFLSGDVIVEFQPGGYQFRRTVGGAAESGGRSTSIFTVSSTLQQAGVASNALALGPVSLQGPSIGLANVGFKGGKLVITIGIGVDTALLNFGGGGNQAQPSATQANSRVTARLTGVLGKFDIEVDIAEFLNDPLAAIGLSGKFSLDIAGLEVTVPDVVRVSASGIRIAYDPNYDPARNNNRPQELVVIDTATVTFDRFRLSGRIDPWTDTRGTTTPTDDIRYPGLVVRENGFAIGRATLIYGTPPALPTPPGTPPPQVLTSATPGTPIRLLSVLEFDDIRFSVAGLDITFGERFVFSGEITIASGGARFFPGRPISATISDRKTAEPRDGAVPDSEALSMTLAFDDQGVVESFRFNVDTFRVQLGSFLTLTGRDLILDTGAADDREMISFGMVGAEVTIGSLVIAGEGRNFAFRGDGNFVAKDGFGVSLSVGSAAGSTFQWPSWLPIRIDEIGLSWPNIQADPADFVLTLSASVTGLQGIAGLEFSGRIEGVKIDIGKLRRGEFPITDIASIGVSVSGNLFGGQLHAALIGGILKIDAGGRIIDSFDVRTAVEARIFFIGFEGGFSFSGIGGITIRFAVSELGPLGVFLSASLPGGIVLEPVFTGLAMNDFAAGVEFFKTLPSIEDPFELRRPEFNLPLTVDPTQWLASVKQQVVLQYLAIRANPALNGFTAAFTSPMLITGSAKIFSIFTSKEVFNGQVTIRFSTDGKFLIIGKLNFASDQISMSGKLYADLSRVSTGNVTVLFLADIPDQVRLLTFHGKIKMGFRNASGVEVEIPVAEPPPAQPTARLAGPRNADAIAAGNLNGRGYIDVVIPAQAGGTLDPASVTDLAPEFRLDGPATIALDEAQAPVIVSESARTYRFWTIGAATPGSLTVTFLRETFAYVKTTGERVFNAGAYQDGEGDWQDDTADAQTIALSATPYVDVTFLPGPGATLNTTSIGAAGGNVFRLERRNAVGVALETKTPSGSPTPLPGGKTYRYYFAAGTTFQTADWTAVFDGNVWKDSSNAFNTASSGTFSVVNASARVAGPFNPQDTNGDGVMDAADRPSIDVGILNAPTNGRVAGTRYVDVIFRPTPGATLDYASIFDAGAEFTVRDGAGATVGVEGAPTAVAMVADDNGVLRPYSVTASGDGIDNDTDGSTDEADERYTADGKDNDGDGTVDEPDELYKQLADEGVTRFRYDFTSATYRYPVGEVTIGFVAFDGAGAGWKDTNGSQGAAETQIFRVEGPTAALVDPAGGSSVDFAKINERNWIDVRFPAPPAGYDLDVESVTDLAPEFTLDGAGVGSVVLANDQAPVQIDATTRTFRFWLQGSFTADDVTVTYLPRSWSFRQAPGAPPAPISVVLNNAAWLEVTIPAAPAGLEIDAASILDAGDEFTLTPPAGKTIELVPDKAPVRIGEGTIYRFRVTGDFLTDGTQSATVTFLDQAWSFVDATGAVPAPDPRGDLSGTNVRSYVDVRFRPSSGADLDTDSIAGAADGPEFEFSGDGAGDARPEAAALPLSLGGGVFRYLLEGSFGVGPVRTTFTAGAFEDDAGFSSLEQVATFTVEGPTADLTTPAPGAAIGVRSLNDRGFFDVTITVPVGTTLDVASVTDPADEFTIQGPTQGNVRLDPTQTPTLVRVAGRDYTFRYWTLGEWASGEVSVRFVPGAYSTVDGAGAVTASTFVGPLTVDASTINAIWLEVEFQPTGGRTIDADAITDAADEFSIGGPGRGSAALDPAKRPTPIAGTNAWRYYLTGAFTGGEVTISFAASSFQSVEVDRPGAIDADGIGNLPEVERFTVQELRASLADPLNGGFIDRGELNGRGYFDVSFTVPGYAASLDLDSVTDLEPEFTVSEAGVVLDPSQPPTLLDHTGNVYTFRYWYNGEFRTGPLTLTFLGGSWEYQTTASDAIPGFADVEATVQEVTGQFVVDVWYGDSPDLAGISTDDFTPSAGTVLSVAARGPPGAYRYVLSGVAAGDELTLHFTGNWNYGGQAPQVRAPQTLTLAAGSNRAYIDVRFPTTAGSALALASIDGDELTITDATGVVSFDPAPTAMADGVTFRYYLTRSVAAGTVTVQFVADRWSDEDGNAGIASTERFQVVEQVADTGSDPLGRVFFIEISGGMQLQGLGFTDEPIIEIRGRVVLEIGDRVRTDGSIAKRFSVVATGTIKIIKLGNIGSVAAALFLEAGRTSQDELEVDLWGVAKIQLNLEFLQNIGIFLEGSATLQVNFTDIVRREQLFLEGIPGDLVVEDVLTAGLSERPANGPPGPAAPGSRHPDRLGGVPERGGRRPEGGGNPDRGLHRRPGPDGRHGLPLEDRPRRRQAVLPRGGTGRDDRPAVREADVRPRSRVVLDRDPGLAADQGEREQQSRRRRLDRGHRRVLPSLHPAALRAVPHGERGHLRRDPGRRGRPRDHRVRGSGRHRSGDSGHRGLPVRRSDGRIGSGLGRRRSGRAPDEHLRALRRSVGDAQYDAVRAALRDSRGLLRADAAADASADRGLRPHAERRRRWSRSRGPGPRSVPRGQGPGPHPALRRDHAVRLRANRRRGRPARGVRADLGAGERRDPVPGGAVGIARPALLDRLRREPRRNRRRRRHPRSGDAGVGRRRTDPQRVARRPHHPRVQLLERGRQDRHVQDALRGGADLGLQRSRRGTRRLDAHRGRGDRRGHDPERDPDRDPRTPPDPVDRRARRDPRSVLPDLAVLPSRDLGERPPEVGLDRWHPGRRLDRRGRSRTGAQDRVQHRRRSRLRARHRAELLRGGRSRDQRLGPGTAAAGDVPRRRRPDDPARLPARDLRHREFPQPGLGLGLGDHHGPARTVLAAVRRDDRPRAVLRAGERVRRGLHRRQPRLRAAPVRLARREHLRGVQDRRDRRAAAQHDRHRARGDRRALLPARAQRPGQDPRGLLVRRRLHDRRGRRAERDAQPGPRDRDDPAHRVRGVDLRLPRFDELLRPGDALRRGLAQLGRSLRHRAPRRAGSRIAQLRPRGRVPLPRVPQGERGRGRLPVRDHRGRGGEPACVRADVRESRPPLRVRGGGQRRRRRDRERHGAHPHPVHHDHEDGAVPHGLHPAAHHDRVGRRSGRREPGEPAEVDGRQWGQRRAVAEHGGHAGPGARNRGQPQRQRRRRRRGHRRGGREERDLHRRAPGRGRERRAGANPDGRTGEGLHRRPEDRGLRR